LLIAIAVALLLALIYVIWARNRHEANPANPIHQQTRLGAGARAVKA
jgi:hypothetical protein